jgi:hypothetical protein
LQPLPAAPFASGGVCQAVRAALGESDETTDGTKGSRRSSPLKRVDLMLKFLGGTVGVIFLIGLIVVIALFKLVF